MYIVREQITQTTKKTKAKWNAIYFRDVQNIGLGPVYLIRDDDNDGDDRNNNNGTLIHASGNLFIALYT